MKVPLFLIVIILVSTASFYYAGREAYRNYNLAIYGVEVLGRVTGKTTYRNDKSYREIVFVDKAGNEHRFETKDDDSYKTDQQIPILYDKTTGRIRIKSFSKMYLGSVLLTLLGLFLWLPIISGVLIGIAQSRGWINVHALEKKLRENAKLDN